MKISHAPDEEDGWVCLCGNMAYHQGFYPCNAQGEMVEPKFLERKGPNGTYSHCCISRADQSLNKTNPKM